MSASTTDKFKKVGASTVTTLASPGKALGATSINVGSTTNYPTDTGIVIAIREVDSNGELVAGTYTEWFATVSSATSLAIDAAPAYGSDRVYTAGSTTQVYIPTSAKAQNDLIDGILAQHNQDGTHKAITAPSVTATGTVQGATVVSTGDVQIRSTSLETIASERFFDHVASGCVLSGTGYGSTLAWSLTSGVVYINGRRLTVAAASGTVTASKDTYFDLNDPGTGTVATLVNTGGNIVANNAASPALAANNVRVGIVVTGATNIASAGSVNQGQEDKVLPIASSIAYSVTDSLGNLICPRDPNRKILGYRQQTSNVGGFSTTHALVGGLSCPVIVPTGRKVKIVVEYPVLTPATALGELQGSIWEGTAGSGTQLQLMKEQSESAGTTNSNMHLEATRTPSSTSVTYQAGAGNNGSGSSTTTVNCSTTAPAYIRVELV